MKHTIYKSDATLRRIQAMLPDMIISHADQDYLKISRRDMETVGVALKRAPYCVFTGMCVRAPFDKTCVHCGAKLIDNERRQA